MLQSADSCDLGEDATNEREHDPGSSESSRRPMRVHAAPHAHKVAGTIRNAKWAT